MSSRKISDKTWRLIHSAAGILRLLSFIIGIHHCTLIKTLKKINETSRILFAPSQKWSSSRETETCFYTRANGRNGGNSFYLCVSHFPPPTSHPPMQSVSQQSAVSSVSRRSAVSSSQQSARASQQQPASNLLLHREHRADDAPTR